MISQKNAFTFEIFLSKKNAQKSKTSSKSQTLIRSAFRILYTDGMFLICAAVMDGMKKKDSRSKKIGALKFMPFCKKD